VSHAAGSEPCVAECGGGGFVGRECEGRKKRFGPLDFFRPADVVRSRQRRAKFGTFDVYVLRPRLIIN
jgi:hypothetical protein